MRIISGQLRGRRLVTPRNDNVRPTTDKVKEALFNMIAPDVEGSVVIDLFSGTGNLGLEAISRGAKRVYFVDKSRESYRLIKENIAICKAEEQSIVMVSDYLIALDGIKEKVDIVLLDPPYKAGFLTNCFEKLLEMEILQQESLVVAEHGLEEALPEQISYLTKVKEKRYGQVVISIYQFDQNTEELQ